jgi:type IV secretion system protein VirB1
MPLPLIDMQHLAATCAPSVAPQTLLSVAKVESGFDPLAIGVNGPRPMRLHPHNREEAVATATRLIDAGADIDLGVSQINSRNLGWLDLTVSDAFDACRNLAASAKIIAAGYDRAGSTPGGEQAALHTALSYYNTGDPSRGYRNGYVNKVLVAAGRVVPALAPQDDILPRTSARLAPTPAPPAWDVFGHASTPVAGFVFSPQLSGDDR